MQPQILPNIANGGLHPKRSEYYDFEIQSIGNARQINRFT